MERNDFSNFDRRLPRENFYEIILKSVHWSRRRCHLKVFQFLALVANWPFCSEERNDFSNFSRRPLV